MNYITSPNLIQLPQYQSHKKVWALKIESLNFRSDGALDIIPEDKRYGAFTVPKDFIPKHREAVPSIGWDWVQYENGYQSFSPADAFESGYTLIK